NGDNPKFKNTFEYYVDQDFALPEGAIWLSAKDNEDAPKLVVRMWFRDTFAETKTAAYLYYNGKAICNTEDSAQGNANTNAWVMAGSDDHYKWSRVDFYFNCVRAFDKHPEYHGDFIKLKLDSSPGEYEIKVLRNGQLSRDGKFKVEGGAVVDSLSSRE